MTLFRSWMKLKLPVLTSSLIRNKSATNVCNIPIRFCSENVQLKEKFNVGTLGHVDHGKTTLSAAITKVLSDEGLSKFVPFDQIDKAPEEKQRGITINAAHLVYASQKREYAHIDCPGHSDFVKNMISGTSQMDGAVIVVAADDGQMPQTREHLRLARLIGLRKMIVFINKADLVDSDVLELVEIEMVELLEEYGFEIEDVPVIYGSALKALNGDKGEYGSQSIMRLLDAMDTYFKVPQRDLTSPFWLGLDNIMQVPQKGVIGVGTVRRGVIEKGCAADIVGHNKKLRCRVGAIQIFKEPVPRAVAGENIGVLIRNVKFDSLKRGMVLAAPQSCKCSNRFTAMVYVLSREEGGRSNPVVSKYTDMMYMDTWSSTCRIDLLESDMIIPGEHGLVQVTLLKGMALLPGSVFTIRERTVITVMTGQVKDILDDVQIYQNRIEKIDETVDFSFK